MTMRILSTLVVSLSLTACSANYLKMDIKPSNAPMYNMTESSKVLACVGRHITATQLPPIDVYISDIPDHTTTTIETGFLTKNAVMMVTTAVDRLGTDKVEVIGRNGAAPGRRQVQILGAWTELNRTTSSDALKGAASFPGGVKLDLGGDRSFNHIALDMSMAEDNRIVPQTATSVSIQVNTRSGNSTLTYDDGGDFAAVAALGFTAQEGFHSAERLLIETTVALMMSRYYGIDMNDCLNRTGEPDKKKIDKDIFRAVPAAVGGDPAATSDDAQSSRQPMTLGDNPAPGERFQADARSLPMKDGVVILPRAGKGKKYLAEQPEEYTERRQENFSGATKTVAQEEVMQSAMFSPQASRLQTEAQQGSVSAQYELGVLYAKGKGGMPANKNEAMKWLKMAAEQGNTQAQTYVGILYSGMQDYRDAAVWFQKAAEQGNFEAQYNLGVLNASGAGIMKNNKEAYFWLSLALEQRNDPAVRHVRDQVTKQLSAADLAAVKLRVQQWDPPS